MATARSLNKFKNFIISNYKPGEKINYLEAIHKLKIKNKESLIEEVKSSLQKINEDSEEVLFETLVEVLDYLTGTKYKDYEEIVSFFREQKKFSKVKEERILSTNLEEEVLSSFEAFIKSIPIPIYMVYITSNVETFKEYYKKYNQPDILIVYLPENENKSKERIINFLQNSNISFQEV